MYLKHKLCNEFLLIGVATEVECKLYVRSLGSINPDTMVSITVGLRITLKTHSSTPTATGVKLADQRPYRSSAANHVGAAVLAHVARSGRSDAALR